MVGIFRSSFGEETLEETFLFVAIMVAILFAGVCEMSDSKVSVDHGHCIIEECLRLWKVRIA